MAASQAEDIFSRDLPARLKAKADVVKQIGTSYKFVLSGDGGGTWVVDLAKDGGTITKGDGEAKCTLMMAAGDFVEMMQGKLNPQMAFMSGKLKVAGDMGLALKLGSLLS